MQLKTARVGNRNPESHRSSAAACGGPDSRARPPWQRAAGNAECWHRSAKPQATSFMLKPMRWCAASTCSTRTSTDCPSCRSSLARPAPRRAASRKHGSSPSTPRSSLAKAPYDRTLVITAGTAVPVASSEFDVRPRIRQKPLQAERNAAASPGRDPAPALQGSVPDSRSVLGCCTRPHESSEM